MMKNKYLFITKEEEFAQIKRSLEERHESLEIDLIDCHVKGFNMYLCSDYNLVTVSPDLTRLEALQLISSLRSSKSSSVVVVTGEKQYDHWIKALNFGANCVLPRELPLEGKISFFTSQYVHSFKRPSIPVHSGALMFNEYLILNPITRQACVNAIPIVLSPRQYDLLLFLASNPDKIMTYEGIAQNVWQAECVDPNIIAAIVSKLRQAIEPNPQSPEYIETIYKVGYRFNSGVFSSSENAPR